MNSKLAHAHKKIGQSTNGFTPLQEQQIVRETNATLKEYQIGKVKGYRTTKALLRDVRDN